MPDNDNYDPEVSLPHPTPIRHHDFGAAIDLILTGRVMRRLSWPDDGTVIALHNDLLSIFTPMTKGWHPLMVSLADMQGEDWVLASYQS